MLQDTVRDPARSTLPFYDSKKVAVLLEQLSSMTEADRVSWDPVLISVLSACVLEKRFGL